MAAKSEVALPIIKRLDGVGYPDFIYGQVALREYLLAAPPGRVFVDAHIPGRQPFRGASLALATSTMASGGGAGGGGDGGGGGVVATPSAATTPAAAALMSSPLHGHALPSEPLGAAMMEFLCHSDVRAAGVDCAERGVRNLVSHPFARHIQVRGVQRCGAFGVWFPHMSQCVPSLTAFVSLLLFFCFLLVFSVVVAVSVWPTRLVSHPAPAVTKRRLPVPPRA